MGTQGEIYVVLGKRFPIERIDSNPKIDKEPIHLLYRLNNKIITIREDNPNKYQFLDGFMAMSNSINLDSPILGVKVLGVDSELGELNAGKPLEALVGYAVANESYVTNAKALPPMNILSSLKSKLASDITSQIGLAVPLEDLELHLLYEFSQ
ncbi:hypothetical protein KW805_01075 [Candidatus Pacearchaeota archaeon]|nr:hypothetical protein [Candidatus Pacearchaeota archaeon]